MEEAEVTPAAGTQEASVNSGGAGRAALCQKRGEMELGSPALK